MRRGPRFALACAMLAAANADAREFLDPEPLVLSSSFLQGEAIEDVTPDQRGFLMVRRAGQVIAEAIELESDATGDAPGFVPCSPGYSLGFSSPVEALSQVRFPEGAVLLRGRVTNVPQPPLNIYSHSYDAIQMLHPDSGSECMLLQGGASHTYWVMIGKRMGYWVTEYQRSLSLLGSVTTPGGQIYALQQEDYLGQTAASNWSRLRLERLGEGVLVQRDSTFEGMGLGWDHGADALLMLTTEGNVLREADPATLLPAGGTLASLPGTSEWSVYACGRRAGITWAILRDRTVKKLYSYLPSGLSPMPAPYADANLPPDCWMDKNGRLYVSNGGGAIMTRTAFSPWHAIYLADAAPGALQQAYLHSLDHSNAERPLFLSSVEAGFSEHLSITELDEGEPIHYPVDQWSSGSISNAKVGYTTHGAVATYLLDGTWMIVKQVPFSSVPAES